MKTQGKLAVIIRFCCFTMISKPLPIQVKCLRLVVSQTGVLGSVTPPTSKSMTPLCKPRGASQDQRKEMLAFLE